MASPPQDSEATAVAQDSRREYRRPASGVLALLPDAWVPYAELARIEKPTGIYLFYFPHLFGVLYASAKLERPPMPRNILYMSSMFFVGTIFMRAAACAWNDYIDIDYDRRVERCRLRPLARSALTPTQGLIFALSQALIASWFLFMLPGDVLFPAVPSTGLLWLYPFAKRFTEFPQAVLGVQVGLGFLMGLLSMGYRDWFNYPLATPSFSSQTLAVLVFYGACTLWTIFYDTIYAQQDIKDDAKAGVKSMAVRFEGSTKLMLSSVAIGQISCLVAAGFLDGMGSSYFTLTCAGTAVALGTEIWLVDLTVPADCMWWFKSGCWFVGTAMASGVLGEYLIG